MYNDPENQITLSKINNIISRKINGSILDQIYCMYISINEFNLINERTDQ